MTCDQRLMRLAARDGGHLMPEKCEAIALAAGGINSAAPTRSVHRVGVCPDQVRVGEVEPDVCAAARKVGLRTVPRKSPLPSPSTATRAGR
jgi:hypothetical protein